MKDLEKIAKILKVLEKTAILWSNEPPIPAKDDPYKAGFNDGVAESGERLKDLLQDLRTQYFL